MENLLQKRFGLKSFPIIQAPMAGSFIPPSFVATVSNNGAIGSIGAGYMAPETLRTQMREVKNSQAILLQ